MANPPAPVPAQPQEALTGGILLVLLANLLFSMVDSSTKWLIGAGLVAAQLAFMRYAVHFAITLTERAVRGRPNTLLARQTRSLVLFRAFCLVSATLANFIALSHLSLAVASSLLYLSPLFVCLFAKLLLDESMRASHILAICLGGFGAVLIVWPFTSDINWYAVLMLYPAAALALYQVLTRKLVSSVRPGLLQFYTGAVGTIMLAPLAVPVWVAPESLLNWSLLIGIGAFAWAGHEVLTRAHAFAPASALAPFGYSFVIYLTAFGFIIFGEIPQSNELFGMGIIITAGLLSWRLSAKHQLSIVPHAPPQPGDNGHSQA
ncbi:MAG: DMT family transporter [Arenibacterium sp.]